MWKGDGANIVYWQFPTGLGDHCRDTKTSEVSACGLVLEVRHAAMRSRSLSDSPM